MNSRHGFSIFGVCCADSNGQNNSGLLPQEGDENMEVSAWNGGNGGTYGIRVGSQNRDRFFDPSWERIEVEIDGALHTFNLTRGFWKKCPEFRDSGEPLIRDWLRHNFMIPWEKSKPPHFTLEVVGERRFRLIPF